MGDHQIIRSPLGEELVVLPKAEYDALVEALEDVEDVTMFDVAMKEIATDPFAILPVEVSGCIQKGERRLRAMRKWRGLSVAELSAGSGVAQEEIERIERGPGPQGGVVTAPTETLTALARALDIPLAWID